MSLFGNKPAATSPYQKPMSRPSERLGFNKPAPRQEVKPAPKPESKGLFGKDYTSFGQQREFAGKAPFEPMPGSGQKLGKEERVGLVKELEERAKKIGQFHGLSKETFQQRILPQMQKEIQQLQNSGQINKANELRKKIRQYQEWAKGS